MQCIKLAENISQVEWDFSDMIFYLAQIARIWASFNYLDHISYIIFVCCGNCDIYFTTKYTSNGRWLGN